MNRHHQCCTTKNLDLVALCLSAHHIATACLTSGLLLCLPAHADLPDWWRQASNRAQRIIDDGREELYLSGYAYHGRHTYTAERIAEFNEKAWGLGYGRSLRNDKGNDESLYFLAISDSHAKPQPMLGYAYQWTWATGMQNLEVGIGYTAMLVSRADYFGGIPFPAILPVGSVGTRQLRLIASYVPHISNNKGNGNVLFIFFRGEL